MGVKDLWPTLQPVCERKSLWELQDKIIAIDLSCWICDSQNVGEYSSQPNMYLRNIFFRASVLLLLGATPIFVLEGDAPELKAAVMEQRNVARGYSQTQKGGVQKPVKRNRSQLKCIQRKCCQLLDCLGVKYVQSDGEAEALCALLNKNGLVDGCVSQDTDCFLYGAKRVYRNFSITTGSSSTGGPGFSIDSYSMADVEDRLGLTRNKLIALSLLCGCDYLKQGVAGVGKDSALKFVSNVPDKAILERLREWRASDHFEQLELERTLGGCEQCGHIGGKRIHLKEGCQECKLPKGCIPSFNPQSLCQMEPEQKKTLILELTIRKKALLDSEFPSEPIINEFLRPNIRVPAKLDTQWGQPDILGFLRLAFKFLNWEEAYAFNKFLPILTRWVVLQNGNEQTGESDICPLYPERIIKTRVLRGVPSFELKWADKTGLFESFLKTKTKEDSENEDTDMFCTIEPKSLIEKAYPNLVLKFTTQQREARGAKQKGNAAKERKGRKRRSTKKKQSSPSRSIEKSEIKKKRTCDSKPCLEELNLSLLIDNEDEENEADLSAVVMAIVGEEAYYAELPVSSSSNDSSPARKRTKSNHHHPYSPLGGPLPLDDRPTSAKLAISKSNAAKRFSASFKAFSTKQVTFLES